MSYSYLKFGCTPLTAAVLEYERYYIPHLTVSIGLWYEYIFSMVSHIHYV